MARKTIRSFFRF